MRPQGGGRTIKENGVTDKRLTDYVLLGYRDAQDYLRGDDSARGRNEPQAEGECQSAYRDGWIAAYMDEYRRGDMLINRKLTKC